MLKKILAILMASVLALGIFTVGASAEDAVEEPAYTPVEYKIEDLVAAIEAKQDTYLNPADIILLPEQQQEEPETPEELIAQAEADISPVLIVEYQAGTDASSGNSVEKFVDYSGSGYAVRALGDYPQYAYVNGARKTNLMIDYASDLGYGFKQWKVTSVYSGTEFNRVILEAEWDVPPLTGWEGYKTMMRGYIKTVIDYVINYLAELFARIGSFLV
ncbi:MAG: hypothetical protein ACI4I5_10660 [Acutalibacteraceae bacterium]